MKYHTLFKQSLLIAALAFSSTVQAQDDEKLDQILELLGTMKTEQERQAAEIDELKESRSTPVDTDETPSKAPTEEEIDDDITREGGFIATVHPARNGKEQGMLGRMIVDGFPMKQNVAHGKFDLDEKQEVAYHSAGELNIKEDGLHSFSIRKTGNWAALKCRFRFEINGQPVLDIAGIGKETHSADVNLGKGWYEFTMYQNCESRNSMVWNFSILEPSALDPVPLTGNYLFYRK